MLKVAVTLPSTVHNQCKGWCWGPSIHLPIFWGDFFWTNLHSSDPVEWILISSLSVLSNVLKHLQFQPKGLLLAGSKNTLKCESNDSFNSITLIQMEMIMRVHPILVCTRIPAALSFKAHTTPDRPQSLKSKALFHLKQWLVCVGLRARTYPELQPELALQWKQNLNPLFMNIRNSYRKACFTWGLILLED